MTSANRADARGGAPASAGRAGIVQAVSPDGPAAAAGLSPRDLITNVGGSAATENLQVEKIALTKRPGDTVSLGYDRVGHSSRAVITLTAQP